MSFDIYNQEVGASGQLGTGNRYKGLFQHGYKDDGKCLLIQPLYNVE